MLQFKKYKANLSIRTQGDLIIVTSYESDIFKLDTRLHRITFGRDYGYSTTTAKHRNYALRELGYGDLAGATSEIEKWIQEGFTGHNGSHWGVSFEDTTQFTF